MQERLHQPDLARGYNLSKPLEAVLEDKKSDVEDLSYEMVEKYFKDVRNGFFIEAGASGGVEDSHSLLLESQYNWSGLLVEPVVWSPLKYVNRQVPVAWECLALEPNPHYVEFDFNTTVVIEELDRMAMPGIVAQKSSSSHTMQCIPLYSLLLAMANPTVHWFILDIEGAEYQVLQTIPWDKVDIEMVSVETDLAGLVMKGSRQDIIDYMARQGYIHRVHKAWEQISHFVDEPKDDLFIRKDVAERYGILHNEL